MSKNLKFAGFGQRMLALFVALATMMGMVVVAAPQATAADNRANLRPGCHWAKYKFFVQNCYVDSPAMGQKIMVQIQASSRGGNAGLYMLDGLRAPDTYSDWTYGGDAPRKFVNDNVTLVMPVGGKGQFYTDWSGPWNGDNGPMKPRWETFLTRELPDYLARDFGVSKTNNSIIGLSMGAMAAMTLAGWNRDQFKQATSFSGYLNPTWPGFYLAMHAAMQDSSGPGAQVWNMWGSPVDPRRVRNDPTLNAGRFNGMPLYLSSSPGTLATPSDFLANPAQEMSAILLEFTSRNSTAKFELAARAAGANVTVNYPPDGVHNWSTWNRELNSARPHILRALGA